MNEIAFLMAYVLTRAEHEPMATRIKLYRSLARICGDPQEEAHLRAIADSLQANQELCAEFNFSFIQKNKDK